MAGDVHDGELGFQFSVKRETGLAERLFGERKRSKSLGLSKVDRDVYRVGCHPFGMRFVVCALPVVSLTLNHQLLAVIPAGMKI